MTHHLDNTLLELICELLDEYGFVDLSAPSLTEP